MIGKLIMSNAVLRKIKIRRFFILTARKIRKRIEGYGTIESVLTKEQTLDIKVDKTKKYKSTLAVAVCGLAIGVSHMATLSVKYNKNVSRKAMFIVGGVVSVISSYVWYNYVDAANEGISEEDIEMMVEMVNGADMISKNPGHSSFKSMDIIHTIITGKPHVDPEDYIEEEPEEEKRDTEYDVFGKVQRVEDDEKESSSDIKRSVFGTPMSSRVGKRLANTSRSPFIPVEEVEEEDEEEDRSPSIRESWLDL